jgi:hypothetical protein
MLRLFAFGIGVEIRIVFERDCDLGLNKVIDGLYT